MVKVNINNIILVSLSLILHIFHFFLVNVYWVNVKVNVYWVAKLKPYCVLGYQLPLQKQAPLFAKTILKYANCPSPLFGQSPYILVFSETPF